MTLVQKIFKNTSFLTVSEIVQKVLLFFLIIYAVRVLGPANFGKYSFAVAFTYFFLFISELGLTTIITRDVARDLTKTQQYFSNLFMFKLILFGVAYILIYLLINLLGYPKLTILVVMIFQFVADCRAQDDQDLAKQSQNPIGNMISLPIRTTRTSM